MKKILLLSIILCSFSFLQEDFELNTILMKSTFRIASGDTTGTVFILGKLSQYDSSYAYYVLITAHHVLNNIKSDEATLFLRSEENSIYTKLPKQIKIRDNGKPLWKKHPEVDVAAMYISISKGVKIPLLPLSFLATDSLISAYDLHPGDELLCLGYPFGAEANIEGFPILRSGKIASFPILPTKKVKYILYDFNVFGGNSGGPVYFIGLNRSIKGKIRMGKEVRMIIGLVSEQMIFTETIASSSELTLKNYQLGLAKVIPATFIIETIELLPKK